MTTITRACGHCGGDYQGRKPSTLDETGYCSKECKRQAIRRVVAERNPHTRRVSTGTLGAVGELRVAADLLCKGWEVFRSMSPNCSCDLIAMKDGEFKRIEVRTGYNQANGTISWSYTQRDNGRSDILAVVTDRHILYPTPDEIGFRRMPKP